MAQVAARAGVSISTVSRALAGNPLISEKTRRAVERAATRLGYRVDAAGSSLRTGLTRTVGVVIPLEHTAQQKLSDPFFLELIGAIADELSAADYSLLLGKVAGDPSGFIRTAMSERRVDGVIVIGQSWYHESLNTLATEGLPLVVWGARLPDQAYRTVGSDNELGGEMATAHLVAQGCRDIVFLGDPTVPEVAARKSGYLRALRASRLTRRQRLEVPARFGGDAAYRAIAALLDREVPFDGIVACSDVFAMGAMRALIEKRVRVPQDVQVAGFDDIPLAGYTTPPLTTIHQDYAAGGRALVDLLMRALRHEAVESVVIPTRLVVRDSSIRNRRSRRRAASRV